MYDRSTKKDLVQQVMDRMPGLTMKQVKKFINTVLNRILMLAKNSEVFSLNGFMTFTHIRTKRRIRDIIGTGGKRELRTYPAKDKLRVRISKSR